MSLQEEITACSSKIFRELYQMSKRIRISKKPQKDGNDRRTD